MPQAFVPADDLRVGDWVAVRDTVDDDRPSFVDDMEPAFIRRLRRESPSPQPGTPLRILAVELPWVYVAVLDDDGHEAGPEIVDVRRLDLVRISPAIPEAIVAFGRKKRDDEAARELEAGRRKAVARAQFEFARKTAAERDAEAAVSPSDHGSDEGSEPRGDHDSEA